MAFQRGRTALSALPAAAARTTAPSSSSSARTADGSRRLLPASYAPDPVASCLSLLTTRQDDDELAMATSA